MIERVPMVDPDDGKSQHRSISSREISGIGSRRPFSMLQNRQRKRGPVKARSAAKLFCRIGKYMK
jgi:hypothetical protein